MRGMNQFIPLKIFIRVQFTEFLYELKFFLDKFTNYWHIVVGFTGTYGMLVDIYQHRIESPWIISYSACLWEDDEKESHVMFNASNESSLAMLPGIIPISSVSTVNCA